MIQTSLRQLNRELAQQALNPRVVLECPGHIPVAGVISDVLSGKYTGLGPFRLNLEDYTYRVFIALLMSKL
jgi:hypothetical protein